MKNSFSTLTTVIIFILLFCFVAGMAIKFKPFKISFSDLPTGIGYVFLILAIGCFHYAGFRAGEKSGYKDALEDVVKACQKTKEIPKEINY